MIQEEVTVIVFDVLRETVQKDPKIIMKQIRMELPSDVTEEQIREALKYLWEKESGYK